LSLRTVQKWAEDLGQGERFRVSQPAVLIVSGQPEFSQSILTRWQLETNLPPVTVVNCDLCESLAPDSFDLAIVGGLPSDRLETLLRQLDQLGKTLLVLAPDAATADCARAVAPRSIVLEQIDEWLTGFLLLASETVRRLEAESRARQAAQDLAASENNAKLGRYITEQRHAINNALTSVMGNSELLAFDAANLSAHQLSQIETIRTMSVRIHEIMQRLSSLESETKWMEKQKEHERKKQASAAS